jgi:hypothetical protein
MTGVQERFREITEHGVIPRPSGAGAVVIHAEEGRDCRVVLGVMRRADKADLIAIVTLRSCMQSVFGYPNDEAYRHDPRGVAGDRPGYGFYEVLSSAWPARLVAYNRHAFPDRTPAHYSGMRHFFVGCHDTSGEFLAEDLTVEVTDLSYEVALREAVDRTIGLSPGGDPGGDCAGQRPRRSVPRACLSTDYRYITFA